MSGRQEFYSSFNKDKFMSLLKINLLGTRKIFLFAIPKFRWLVEEILNRIFSLSLKDFKIQIVYFKNISDDGSHKDFLYREFKPNTEIIYYKKPSGFSLDFGGIFWRTLKNHFIFLKSFWENQVKYKFLKGNDSFFHNKEISKILDTFHSNFNKHQKQLINPWKGVQYVINKNNDVEALKNLKLSGEKTKNIFNFFLNDKFFLKKTKISKLKQTNKSYKIMRHWLTKVLRMIKNKCKSYIEEIEELKSIRPRSFNEEFLLTIIKFKRVGKEYFSEAFFNSELGQLKIKLEEKLFLKKDEINEEYIKHLKEKVHSVFETSKHIFLRKNYYFLYILKHMFPKPLIVDEIFVKKINKILHYNWTPRTLSNLLERKDWILKVYKNTFIWNNVNEKLIAKRIYEEIQNFRNSQNVKVLFISKHQFFMITKNIKKEFDLLGHTCYYIFKKFYKNRFYFSTGNSMWIGFNKKLSELPFMDRIKITVKSPFKIISFQEMEMNYGASKKFTTQNFKSFWKANNNGFLYLANEGKNIIRKEFLPFFVKRNNTFVSVDDILDFIMSSKKECVSILLEVHPTTRISILKQIFKNNLKRAALSDDNKGYIVKIDLDEQMS